MFLLKLLDYTDDWLLLVFMMEQHYAISASVCYLCLASVHCSVLGMEGIHAWMCSCPAPWPLSSLCVDWWPWHAGLTAQGMSHCPPGLFFPSAAMSGPPLCHGESLMDPLAHAREFGACSAVAAGLHDAGRFKVQLCLSAHALWVTRHWRICFTHCCVGK